MNWIIFKTRSWYLLLFLLHGCVSIQTHEKLKQDCIVKGIENYQAGVVDGVGRAVKEMERDDITKEEIISYLKGFLDVEGLRK